MEAKSHYFQISEFKHVCYCTNTNKATIIIKDETLKEINMHPIFEIQQTDIKSICNMVWDILAESKQIFPAFKNYLDSVGELYSVGDGRDYPESLGLGYQLNENKYIKKCMYNNFYIKFVKYDQNPYIILNMLDTAKCTIVLEMAEVVALWKYFQKYDIWKM